MSQFNKNSINSKQNENKGISEMLETIKKELSKNIKTSREKFNEKLDTMKNAHNRNLKKKNTKVVELKTVTAKNIFKAENQGNYNVCIDLTANDNEDNFFKRNKYCDSKVTDDLSLNSDCKKITEFCNICCETEFGAVYYKDRRNCYDKCDIMRKKI